jgi:hypothetical protein
MNIVVDVVRHLVPLLPLYLLNGSIASYLLLTAFGSVVRPDAIVGTSFAATQDPTSVAIRAFALAGEMRRSLWSPSPFSFAIAAAWNALLTRASRSSSSPGRTPASIGGAR